MVKQTCPHEEQLASFVRCELSEEVAANVLDHLDSCPHCEETVAKLEHTIQSVLPGAAATMIDVPYADESACQRAVQSLVNEFATPIPDTEPGSEPKPIPETGAPAEFQTLRDFRIIEKVGQGGMGAVYKAVHQRMQRTVALKILPSAMIGDQSAVARFSREMSVLGQLNHPNIVQAFDAGDHDGQHYLAMEFIEGQDLASVLRKQGRLSVANACLVVSQVATALQYAHEKGFVHRDIKPSNLMLAETVGADGNPHAIVKLLDLGLARVFEQRASGDAGESAELTSAGQIMGTLDYMAPEQGSDSHQVDIRTDIYSLGATLYKFLSGEAPFAEHAGKAPMQRLMAIATQEARPIKSRCPEVPERLAKVVHRMLEKDPARRFQTPAEVSKAIEEFAVGACLIELLQPGIRSKTEPAKLAPSTEIKGHVGNGKRFSRRFLASMGGFAAFIALSALLVITTRHGRVEVTSPDGQLPADLRIVVLKGGEEVQVLQADNLWTARLVNGEYEVELRGGDDQFAIEDSKLVVTRLGKAVCVVTHTKAIPPNELPTTPVETPLKNSTSATVSGDAKPDPNSSAESSAPIADRDKPFVVVDEAGKTLAEYRFANETLAAPQNGIIEVHGNGPFKLGKVRRESGSLHIRAGKGFRPRFVVGFDLPNNNASLYWFDLTNVDLSIEGCDFTGVTSDQSVMFGGVGGRWKFENCRLNQPYTRVGAIVRFDGESFEASSCQLFTSSPTCQLLHLTTTPSVTLTGNRFLWGGYAVAMQSKSQQSVKLESNVFFGNRVIVLLRDEHSTDALNVDAHDNEFICSTGLVGADPSIDPKTQLTWKGDHNRFAASNAGLLWGFGNPDEPIAFESVTAWNSYWGNPADLETGQTMKLAWDLLNNAEVDLAQTGIATEINNARGKFAGLPELGPDMKLVGAGKAWEEALRSSSTSEIQFRPEPLEGGPFVIIRNSMPVAAYISFSTALEQTQDKDIIEIRSDGPFPEIHIGHAVEKQLTLRAAAGYRPVFDNFNADEKSGDWILEGLHFRGLGSKPALWCAARRIANCSIDYAAVDGRAHLRCPHKADSVEIANCYLSNHTEVISASAKITNSVLSTLATHIPENLPDSTECSIDVERSCLWTHTTPSRPNAGTAIAAVGKQRLHITDSVIDAAHVTVGETTVWSGERNLYRTYGPYESKPVTDEGSVRDESAFLRPELWQRE